MLRNSVVHHRRVRPVSNLTFKGEGRQVTGFMTPYRAWMWKQNELFRNIMEAQFEHSRKTYKRQWFEGFRVNSDEYIYKYNITKAAQIKKWEDEMGDQEKKRLEALHTAEARQALKKKHLEMLREYHERHFFHWYERASERLQYMTQMNFITPESIDAHINKELDKYVAGKEGSYALNFVGQMPMLEDKDGEIVEVPENLLRDHRAMFPDSAATGYEPPIATPSDERGLQGEDLRAQISGGVVSSSEGEQVVDDIHRGVLEDMISEVQQGRTETRTSAMSSAEREIERQKYISRGQVGVKRRDWDKGGAAKFVEGTTAKIGTSASPMEKPSTGVGAGKRAGLSLTPEDLAAVRSKGSHKKKEKVDVIAAAGEAGGAKTKGTKRIFVKKSTADARKKKKQQHVGDVVDKVGKMSYVLPSKEELESAPSMPKGPPPKKRPGSGSSGDAQK